jgi:signal transduction histidine kinase/DNA-directed RNA polymerase subunit N (RpoN/RPB10)
MNHYLKNIQDILQQNNPLTEQDKQVLQKALADADKQWTITNFKLDRTEKVKKTTAILLEETIEELETKRKAVEAQNRELEIEAALERIRSKAMAMHKSDDLNSVVATVFDEFRKLDLGVLRCGIGIFNKGKRTGDVWSTSLSEKGTALQISGDESFDIHPLLQGTFNAWLEQKDFTYILQGEDLITYYKALGTTNFRLPDVHNDVSTFEALKQYYYTPTFQAGNLYAFSETPFSEDAKKVMSRFAGVLNLTYNRFLDLQKAEAQARESKIEAALESVRASSMAMHHSEELEKVVKTLSEKLIDLGLSLDGAFIFFFEKEKRNFHLWIATNHLPTPIKVDIPYAKDIQNNPIIKNLWESIETGRDFINESFSGKAKDDYFGFVSKYNDAKIPEEVRKFQLEAECWTVSLAAGKNSIVGIDSWSGKFITQQNFQVLKRFAKVFEQAYTRFLDLQKAEAQAREAQIELALERVRARTMAMQKSEELHETSQILFQQMKELGEPVEQLTIGIVKETENVVEIFATIQGSQLQQSFRHSIDEMVMNKIYWGWKAQQKSLLVELNSEEIQVYNRYRNELVKSEMFSTTLSKDDRRVIYAAYFSKGMLALGSNTNLSEESHRLLERFAGVFDGIYTRFLDLQKAEAQAREAHIEASLERVRAAAMGMHKSEDLNAAVEVVFEELDKLNLGILRCGIAILDKEKRSADVWSTTKSDQGSIVQVSGDESIDIHPMLSGAFDAWASGKEDYSYDLYGDDLIQYYKSLGATNFNLPEELHKISLNKEELQQYFFVAIFSAGALFTFRQTAYPDEAKKVMKRFANVFNLTYKRFLDLQKAEAQAREAKIELALERVRARTMAMQRSDELSDAAILLFQQVKSFGLESWGCGFNIWEKDDKICTSYFTSPEGKLVEPFQIPLTEDPIFIRFYESRQKGEDFWMQEISGQEEEDHYKYLCSLPVIGDKLKKLPEAGIPFPTFQIDHGVNFSHGNLLFITYEPVPDAHEIFKRFGKVFDQTYTRFLDLQKAEAQAREAKIEAALERVRSRSMGMQKSEELKEVIQVVYEQFVHLNIHIEHTGFIMDYKTRNDMHIWLADQHQVPAEVTVPYFDCAHWNCFNEAKEKGFNFFANHLSFEEKNKFYEDLFKLIPGVPKETLDYYFSCPGLAISTVLLDNVGLYIENFKGIPYSDEENNTLMRFGKVFQQTYTRFLDLQKAEAQSREAQIELGLERVRARAMAMQKSDELAELVDTVFKELTKLDFALSWCMINIVDESTMSNMVWGSNPEIGKPPESYHMLFEDYRFHHEMFKAWKEKQAKWVFVLKGSEKEIYDEYLFNQTEFRRVPEPVQKMMRATKQYVASFTFSNFGGLQTVGEEPLSEENLDILGRFGKVFDLTYTRFNDLQKAEAQAREAKIEAALERVRSQSMGMQTSKDLSNVTTTMFEQLRLLGGELYATGIVFCDKYENHVEQWHSVPGAGMLSPFIVPVDLDHIHQYRYDQWKKGTELFSVEIPEDFIAQHFDAMFNLPTVKAVLEDFAAKNIPMPETPSWEIDYGASFKHGYILVSALQPFSDADILPRFAKVFEQTYTRFLDLQKAEAQAREAQIELGLERVRARAMAMQTSEELKELIGTVFTELTKLDLMMIGSVIIIFDPETNSSRWWMVNSNAPLEPLSFFIKFHEHTPYLEFIKAWKKRKLRWEYELQGSTKKEWDEFLFTQTELASVPAPVIAGMKTPGRILLSTSFNNFGCLNVGTLNPLTEEQFDILLRFAKVFDLTYTRFNDLQKAEAQAREAKIEAALERVRSRTMAMHKSDELQEVSKIIIQQIVFLNLPLFGFGIHICDDNEPVSKAWIGDPTKGQVPTVLYEHTHDSLSKLMYKGWKDGESLLVKKVQGEELKEHFEYMVSITPISSIFETATPPEFIVYHFAYFSHGFFVIAMLSPYEEAQTIFKRFAKVFEQTYTRFLDLQKAEAQAREADIELGLERVRAKAMAMQSSGELAELVDTLFRELTKLDLLLDRCLIMLYDATTNDSTWWIAAPESNALPIGVFVKYHEYAPYLAYIDAWHKRILKWRYVLEGTTKKEWDNFVFSETEMALLPTAVKDGMKSFEKIFLNVSFNNFGSLTASSFEFLPEEQFEILLRFAKVFDSTYTRFNDLQKAEALAREAKAHLFQIEEEKLRAETALQELQATQKQLIQSEKMASLGELTAGIAHEIQNPLNFVNNFSEVSKELLDEMRTALDNGDTIDAKEIANDIIQNLEKINHHGKRADAIVKGMLQHSRSSSAVKEPTDINALADEYLRLCYHGLRAKDKSFNASMKTDFDNSIGNINIIPQDIGRVVLNLLTNAFYVVDEKKKSGVSNYQATVSIGTKKVGDKALISVTDNGNGIPQKVLDKIFQPFFTTKPTGQGTGLGLSLSYDIIKAHGGEIKVETKDGEGSVFIILLPV